MCALFQRSLIKMSKRDNCENKCRGNNLLSEQCYICKSSEHSDILRKPRETYKLDKVDWLHCSAVRKDAVKTLYPVNSVITNVSPLNILSSPVKLGELSSYEGWLALQQWSSKKEPALLQKRITGIQHHLSIRGLEHLPYHSQSSPSYSRSRHHSQRRYRGRSLLRDTGWNCWRSVRFTDQYSPNCACPNHG